MFKRSTNWSGISGIRNPIFTLKSQLLRLRLRSWLISWNLWLGWMLCQGRRGVDSRMCTGPAYPAGVVSHLLTGANQHGGENPEIESNEDQTNKLGAGRNNRGHRCQNGAMRSHWQMLTLQQINIKKLWIWEPGRVVHIFFGTVFRRHGASHGVASEFPLDVQVGHGTSAKFHHKENPIESSQSHRTSWLIYHYHWLRQNTKV